MMKRRLLLMWTITCILITGIAGAAKPTAAQNEALDLPADLYVLLNDGSILRYGVGASGVTQVNAPGEFVVDFGVEDRGTRLAYRTEAGLFLLDTSIPNGVPLPLEDATASLPAFRGQGRSIAFSPTTSEIPGTAIAYTTLDGMRVAYLSQATPSFQAFTDGVFVDLTWSPTGRYLAGQTSDNIWWVYRREGDQLTLTSIIVSSYGTTWVSPSEIVFAPAEGGLKIMNLELANQQTDLLDAGVQYRLPTLTANDTLDFFGRAQNDTAIPEGYGILLRLERGAQQLTTIGTTPIELTGLRWVPGGSLMIAFQAGVLAVFDPATGFGYPLPVDNAVAYDWGPIVPPELRPTPAPPPGQENTPQVLSTLPAPNGTPPAAPTSQPVGTAVGMNLPAALFFLAQDGFGVAQVWRLPPDSRPPQRLTYADVDVSEYAASPDGRAIYYASDGQIWMQRSDIGYPISLQDLTSFAPADFDLSGDGERLAYRDEQLGISILELDQADPSATTVTRVIPNDVVDGFRRSFGHPRFSPLGDQLLLETSIDPVSGDTAGGGFALGVVDLATVQLYLTAPFDANDPRTANARWLRDGRIVAHADANAPQIAPGYYIYGFIGTDTQPTLAASLEPNWIVRADVEINNGVMRALLAQSDDPTAALRVVDITMANGTINEVNRIDAGIGSPQFSRDGRYLVGFQRAPGSIDRGALVIVDVASGRHTLINPVDGLAGEVWEVGF
ncbi:MAG: hypothetical protein U0670_17295 [Anaerolineae bacterium]